MLGSNIMLNTYSQFLDYCHKLKSTPLYTMARNKEFSIEIENDTIYFVPKTSKKRRRVDAGKTQEVLSQLSKFNDWSPGMYQPITFHASYILAVAHHEKSKA